DYFCQVWDSATALPVF
nr:immunoglobulin light chain junction region [Macaca mulatta]MOX69947.1 immunoglobulin light chain junction region [Macaca mulatta]MOX71268.1 immunoglobulin light chain junction region [Macaca mulatta]MOX76095.1 immunoglobulin light chain junction region [Macaca mulatta]